MRAHVISYGVVVNTIKVEYLDFMPSLVDATIGGNIGDTWDGTSFSSPQEINRIPETITPRQGLIILSRYGILQAVKDYINSLEGQTKEEAQIDLDYAQEWRRDWPLLCNAADNLGLTTEQVDQMFLEASTI